MDDDDDFFDTISNHSTFKKFNKKDYMSLSRNTVYHSAFELDQVELAILNHNATSEDLKKNNRSFSGTSDMSVDFVLAYDKEGDDEHKTYRKCFEENLVKSRLVLESDDNQRIHFIKIHAPIDVLKQYAELLKMRFPLKHFEDGDADAAGDNVFVSSLNKVLQFCHISLDPKKFHPRKYQLTAEFTRDKEYLFNVNEDNFFDTSVKSAVCSYILEREQYGEADQDKGIKRLIADGVYKAAYPLHDCTLEETCGDNLSFKRNLLLKEWASVSKCIKFQPIDEIRDYFGVKFAIYFTWLGFYTNMLIPAAVFGILTLLYGAFTLKTDRVCEDICTMDEIMCPRCDKFCDYWKLSESCTYSKIQHFVDNPATIAFALFMSVWAAIYLELWKRYSAEIGHRWGLIGFDLQAEPPRPEYLIRLADAKKNKVNMVTQLKEPVVPFWSVKLPSLIMSFATAFSLVMIAVSVVFGITLYRMSQVSSETLYSDQNSYRVYVMPITAALINLVFIIIMNFVYNNVAEWLTEMELQRTQTEFEESLAIKIYMFQFVNYYSSIFYIAFLKGKFVGYPLKYNKVFGLRQEECSPGGCLMELTIQLAIIMIGNQAINTIMEMVVPYLTHFYKMFMIKAGIQEVEQEENIIKCNQWTEDFSLANLESRNLFSEYLEMVLQYGFVTIFITAFPLAPLFALINNVLEMRLDAKKFLKYFRRPVPQRVNSIGVWFPILGILGRISVVSNAFILAFSSHFIPRLVYMLKVSPDHTDVGFLNHSLAVFNTSHYPPGVAPVNSIYTNITTCRYAEYRLPQNDDPTLNYKRPLIYWHILAARLAFIVVYQNVVSFVMVLVEWVIPDISRKLSDKIKREAFLTNETIIKHEREQAKLNDKTTKRWSSVSHNSVYYDANGDVSQSSSA